MDKIIRPTRAIPVYDSYDDPHAPVVGSIPVSAIGRMTDQRGVGFIIADGKGDWSESDGHFGVWFMSGGGRLLQHAWCQPNEVMEVEGPLLDGFAAWIGNETYLENSNFRIKDGGRIAHWSKKVREVYGFDTDHFHHAAQNWVKVRSLSLPTLTNPPKQKTRDSNERVIVKLKGRHIGLLLRLLAEERRATAPGRSRDLVREVEAILFAAE